jgi:hypothetical protein
MIHIERQECDEHEKLLIAYKKLLEEQINVIRSSANQIKIKLTEPEFFNKKLTEPEFFNKSPAISSNLWNDHISILFSTAAFIMMNASILFP